MGKQNLHVDVSPLTNRIFCGSVSANGKSWLGNKTDVTEEACAAVAKHALEFGEPLIVSRKGVPLYEISVKKLDQDEGRK